VRSVTIVLYGATGYEGRQVAEELRRRRIDQVLSGRDADRLARLGEELGVPTQAAALDDDRALRELVEGAAAVINCAGPFTVTGDPLVRAAIAARTHYVDSTGEQAFIRMVFEQHARTAEHAGVALVPALGFNYAPGDCIAHLAAQSLEPLDELVMAYAIEGFGMSRGTLKSGLEIFKGGDVIYEDERWRPTPGGIFRASFDFPEPIGRQTMARFASGEVITVPHHTRTRNVISLATTRTFAPAPLAPALPYVLPGLSLAMRTPLRGLLARATGLLPNGPSEEARREARFTIVAEARGAGGATRQGVVRGSDIYGLTAVTLVHGAELLTAPDFDRAGALGPAAAFDPAAFLNHLGDHGLSWQLGGPEALARLAHEDDGLGEHQAHRLEQVV
jgi:short subunit dehydrogenase-like uncharacterized protein